jgi:hypothetical protein
MDAFDFNFFFFRQTKFQLLRRFKPQLRGYETIVSGH